MLSICSMNKIFKLIFFVLFVFFVMGCDSDEKREGKGISSVFDDHVIEGDSSYMLEEKDVDCFRSVYIYDALSVTLEVGTPCCVKVGGPRCYVEAQEAIVDGETLVLKFKNRDTNYRRTNVFIRMPELHDFEVIGANEVLMKGNTLKGSYLYMEMNHVRRAYVKNLIDVDELTVNLKNMIMADINLKSELLNFSTQEVEKTFLSGYATEVVFNPDNKERVEYDDLTVKETKTFDNI